MRNVRRLVKSLLNRIEWLPSFLPYSKSTACEFVVVSGADSTHYKSLRQFLFSLYKHEPNVKGVVFDLGLLESEKNRLQDSFPLAEIRVFDYSKYPDYFNIKINAGEYAWKPVIFSEIFNKFRCCVCWMDAGNVVTEPLIWVRRVTKKIGMYSPCSSGCISDWTHPKTLEFLNASNSLLNMRNLNGACVAANYQNSKARDIINQWKECALVRECIAPRGSSRENHRQDQAVLSLLAHQSGITTNMPSGYSGFKIHQDIN